MLLLGILKTGITSTKSTQHGDDLEGINNIFGDKDTTKSELQSEVVESIHDDYNTFNSNEVITATQVDNTPGSNNSTLSSSRKSVSKLYLQNTFEEGRQKMIEINILKMRERKKDRKKVLEEFLIQIHDSITNSEASTEDELDNITKPVLFTLWCQRLYRFAL